MLRQSYFVHKEDSASSKSANTRSSKKEIHILHCLDYLRQLVMCGGDMTLEWPAPGQRVNVDGWGISHQCQDWNAIYEWSSAHRSPLNISHII